MKFELIIPIAAQDYETAKINISYLKTFLRPEKIVVISAESVESKIIKDFENDTQISFINENVMIEGLTFLNIKNYLEKFSAEKRTGWYFQQFLKMGYAFVSNCDYYLSWDADTIPIKTVEMFKDGHPIFATKKEYNKDYFETIYNLLGLHKQIEASYIAEHMMFDKRVMQELIAEIDSKGPDPWYINILNHVSPEALNQSGFSEFETYGTYVQTRYPKKYLYRDISALRNGKQLFKQIPSEEILAWLAVNF